LYTDHCISDEELKNLYLIEIEKLLHLNGKSLEEFEGMPTPIGVDILPYENRFIMDEVNYNIAELAAEHKKMIQSLTSE